MFAGRMVVVDLNVVIPKRHRFYERVDQLLLVILASDVSLAHLLQRENNSFAFYRL